MRIESLLLEEIIKLKNINKSLGQKKKHYDAMSLLKVKLIEKQQSSLSLSGEVVNKDMFICCSKVLVKHLSCIRDYESRSDALDLPHIIELNGKKIAVLRSTVKIIKEI